MEHAQMDVQQLEETARPFSRATRACWRWMRATRPVTSALPSLGIPQTVEARRAYRELIVTTPRLGECIGGAILYDETIRQQKSDGTPFIKVLIEAGIIPGIKVDAGAKELAGHPGEKVTEGLDGLRIRLQEYFQMGARFAKWRAVITIGDGIPSWGSIQANAHALARYAALCQEAGLVPVVEPEVLMDGDHTLKQMLRGYGRNTANGVQPVVCATGQARGNDSEAEHGASRNGLQSNRTPDEVADATVNCFLRAVPAAVPAIAFLSGGQSAELASARLNAMNARFKSRLPWAVGIFVFSRHPAAGVGDLEGTESNVLAAQQALVSPRTLQPGCAQRRILPGDGDGMTGNKHNHEGNSGDSGEPGPGPYWRRMHRDWRFLGRSDSLWQRPCLSTSLVATWPGFQWPSAICDACACRELKPAFGCRQCAVQPALSKPYRSALHAFSN
jgi:fructose-bisphosphate aldolase class I